MKRIKVPLSKDSYDIIIGPGLIKDCGNICKKIGIGTDAVVITNSRVWRLFNGAVTKSLRRSEFTIHLEVVADSEKAKSISTAERVLNRLSRYDVDRRIFIVALGGGVVGDLAGFVASVYKRGIPYIQIPTTLLAQVDSSIGGKVAVDLSVAKNMVGAFYQPKIVISDLSAIDTLSTRQMRNGLAEIIKYGIIKDAKLFRYIELNYRKIIELDGKSLLYLVSRASEIKAGVVSKDELDRTGLRAILNYGHTIGHAIESASGYSGKYNHGEAIALGMLAASDLAVSLGMLKTQDADRIKTLIRNVGLPYLIEGVSLNKIYRAHLHDKKFAGSTKRFILADRIGNVRVVNNVPDLYVRRAINKLIKRRG